jgi:hypothetical protein
VRFPRPTHHVHDQHDPVAAQDDRFNAEQIDTPDTVLRLSDEGQPRRPIGIRLGSKAHSKHASHDIFVDLNTKGVSDLLGDTDTTEFRIAVLHLDDGRDELLGWAFRARLSPSARRGEQQAIFAMGQRFVELE